MADIPRQIRSIKVEVVASAADDLLGCVRLRKLEGSKVADEEGVRYVEHLRERTKGLESSECPVGDPDCLGGDGDCHDACDSPE